MADLFTIERSECIGNSLPKLNSNFDAINTDLGVLTQAVDEIATAVESLSAAEEATRIYVNNPSFYKESEFTYGYRSVGNTPGLANQWKDVYINQFLDPLKIEIRVEMPKTVLLHARIHLKHVASTTSVWIRLAQFDTATRDILPSKVLDIASAEAMALYDVGHTINLQAPFVLEPNINYIFGVQTFFWRDDAAVSRARQADAGTRLYPNEPALYSPIVKRGAAKKKSKKGTLISSKEQLNIAEIYQAIVNSNAKFSSVIINGWGTDDSFTEQFNNTASLNTLKDVRAINKYLNDGKSGSNRIGKATKYGYAYDEEYIQKGVKNVSVLRAIVL